jgi:hypothetical protein
MAGPISTCFANACCTDLDGGYWFIRTLPRQHHSRRLRESLFSIVENTKD